jgi:uncharacterized protein (DUF1684 family)
MSPEDHLAEIEAWAAARLAALKAEDGWLHLTDRVEIVPGRHTLGRTAAADLQLHAGPEALGLLVLAEDGTATLDTGAGPQPFLPVPGANPQLKSGGLLLEIMTVEGQHSLRVRDLTLPARAAFPGLARYPVDPAWRIVADWVALDRPQTVVVDLVNGAQSPVQLTHQARFRYAGQDGARQGGGQVQAVDEIVLLPTHEKAGAPMFVIRDRTSGTETYGAARFLIGEVQGDQVVLDFNKAFNPPCAFTDFAVCPLPPPGNVLPFAIRAGEKKPAD